MTGRGHRWTCWYCPRTFDRAWDLVWHEYDAHRRQADTDVPRGESPASPPNRDRSPL